MQIDENMVATLLATAKDETETPAARYAALRHVCQLRGDNYQHVPLEQLRYVAGALGQLPGTMKPLTLKDAAETIATAFARRSAPNIRR